MHGYVRAPQLSRGVRFRWRIEKMSSDGCQKGVHHRETRGLAWFSWAVLALAIGGVLTKPSLSRADEPAAGKCPKGETRTEKGCFRTPEIISKRPPVYPAQARRKGLEGKVTVKYRVTERGTVDSVTVGACTTPGVGFEEAAMAAVKKWRYRPGTQDGQPVPIYVDVVVDFTKSH